jgi:hypothetical protein
MAKTCFKVKVKTTNSSRDTATSADGGYVKCEDGIFYVLGAKVADVEKVVRTEDIISIEILGPGYVLPEARTL